MRELPELFSANRRWAARIEAERPGFFAQLASGQTPKHLWIGCSDSRVTANEIVDLGPGDLFVHRNVANLVVHTDLNVLSVLQFAVEGLGVEHVIVCGHYACGGIEAALAGGLPGLIDNWLRHIQDTARHHDRLLATLADPRRRVDLLCELNVVEQVENVCRTSVLRDAWQRGKKVFVHGWIYGLDDGLLRDLGCTVGASEELATQFATAVRGIEQRWERAERTIPPFKSSR